MASGAASDMPIRILVKGSSTVGWISNVEPGHVSHAYPRELESAMRRDGWPTHVHVSAPLAASSRWIMQGADEEIFAWDPDAILLNTGHMETLHMLIPRWFARHVFTRTARPGRWRRLYRRGVVWPVYSVATKAQARVERMLAPWVFGRRLRAVIAHVDHFIHVANRNGHPLIVVMGLVPPPAPIATFPDLASRIEQTNQAFQALVRGFDSLDVLWFDPSLVLTTDGPKPREALGDGLHFTAEAHATVGRGLADIIEAWAAAQPERATPSVGAQPEQEHHVIHTEN